MNIPIEVEACSLKRLERARWQAKVRATGLGFKGFRHDRAGQQRGI
jgi:hypothetical protein